MSVQNSGSSRVSAVMEVKGVSRVQHRHRVKAVDDAGYSEYWDKFEEYLLSRDMAPDTLETYRRTLYEYLYSASEAPFVKQSIRTYLATKKMEGCEGNTLRNRYYTLKAFFEALDQPWPMKKGDVPKKSQKHKPQFTADDMKAIEEEARESYNPDGGPERLKRRNWRCIRNYAIVRLSNALGPRRIEMHDLNVENYNPPFILIPTGKKGKEVVRELDVRTCKVLDDWLEIRRRQKLKSNDEALFSKSLRGGRLARRSLNDILKKIRESAGVHKNRAGFHAGRRGRVTGLHDSGMSGPDLTKLYGWESPSTVNEYIDSPTSQVEAKLRAAHPFFREQETPEDFPPENEEVDVEDRAREMIKNMTPAERRALLYEGD